jgi:hypothetical protein
LCWKASRRNLWETAGDPWNEVHEVLALAAASGDKIINRAQDVFWGGHSGYFADEGSPMAKKRQAQSAKAVQSTAEQAAVEKLFPAIAKWVQGFGHIEIGDQEGFGFIVRAIDYGGVVFEDSKPNSLTDAMAALEKGLVDYFEREGIDVA